jgi:DNA replication protein DnaC
MASATEVKARLMECLRELHLPTFREGFEDLARRAAQESLSYEQYLGELAEQECQVRRMNRIERWLRESDLPLDKSLTRFDMKRLPTKVSRQARTLLDGAFVDARENVLAFGRSGSGKTHLLCGIAQELVRSGRKVLFGPCSLLVQDLLIAKRDLRLSRHLKKLAAFLLAERYERGSVMITSNLPFSKWESIFKDPLTTAAAIDRLVHHSVILELNVPSYRLEEAQRGQQPAPAEPPSADAPAAESERRPARSDKAKGADV